MIVHIFHLKSIYPLVKVKWGRESFQNIEVNTDEEPLLFKAQLYALTGVEPNRQKVMSQGIVLKDEEWNMTLRNVNDINWHKHRATNKFIM